MNQGEHAMSRRKETPRQRELRLISRTFSICVAGTIFLSGFYVGRIAPEMRLQAAEQPRDEILLAVDETIPEKEILIVAPSISLVRNAVYDGDAAEAERADVPLSVELQEALAIACTENGVPLHVGLGLIETESSFNADAVSSVGCYGLCQLNPVYFPADLSPAENIRAGMEYLGYQLDRYDGDMAAALTAYNAGHDTGARGYATTVLEAAEKWA